MDDIYQDLHRRGAMQLTTGLGGAGPAAEGTISGRFSKTLARSLRPGFIVASGEQAIRLADCEMLETLGASDMGEHVADKIPAEGSTASTWTASTAALTSHVSLFRQRCNF